MLDLAFRQAQPGDADALWRVLKPVVREGTTYPVDPAASREEVFAYYFAADKQVFVADAGGDILGS